MEEKSKVVLVISIFTLIECLTFYIISPKFSETSSFYEKIRVNYEEKNDYLQIDERFDVKIKNQWNVIYRSFAEKICFYDNCNIKIKDVNCKIGIPYISLSNGTLYMKTNTWKKVDKHSLKYPYKILRNEVGCYNENSYFGKEEELKIIYLTPLSNVEKNNYIHAFFTREHLPIKELESSGLSGSDKKEKIAKNVPIFINVKTGEIEIKDYSLLGYLLIISFNIFAFLIWWFFGKDKEFLVPKYLHRKPINPLTGKEEDYITYALMYNGSSTPDKNIIAALILSLKSKGILKDIKKEGFFTKKFIFIFDKEKLRSLDNIPLNNYEKKFLEFLINNFNKKENNNEIIIEIVSSVSNRRKIYKFFNYKFGKEIKNRFENTASIILILSLFLLLFFILFLGENINKHALNILMISYFIIFITTFFEFIFLQKELIRFKKDYYKEFLEIKAFKNFLNDYAQLKKYLPEDEVIWKDWLIIATALGVADNVLKVLKERGYNIDELLDYEKIKNTSFVFASHMRVANSSSGSSISGGGFGGGGGGGR